ncbi:GNAT family N-acetyltransferase [Schaalia sp. ZJ405]|uniref:GNAT family N-acetyltransferase n=1 Tax=unclassified Schaalia TaxID=2691889 RepID=UPI0013EDAFEC|nr:MULTISPECIES: GNAT family N-acetyltransferase [unclassified Schaalia]QPK80589.1 GNAT family N-acetyltransferase [Schaalia sp. ZJ405]
MEQRTLQTQLDVLARAARPASVEIATLTTYDIPQLAALTNEAYGVANTPEALLETSEELRMTFEGAFGRTTEDSFVGAWDGGTLVGAILVIRQSPWDDIEDGPFVVDLVVAPEYRRQGIATALISEISERCIDWGYTSLSLRIDNRHHGAAELYHVLGFEQVS